MISKKERETKRSPITAYRYWRLNIKEKTFFLQSLLADQIWLPHQEVIARHCHGKYEEHGTKGLVYDSNYNGCSSTLFSCGIHALKELPCISKPCLHLLRGEISGKVLLWGFIQEDTEEYRAQYAYPLEIMNIYCRMCYIEMLLLDRISFFSWRSCVLYNSYRAYPCCQKCIKQHDLNTENSFKPTEDMTVEDLLHHLNSIYLTDQIALISSKENKTEKHTVMLDCFRFLK